MNHPEQWEICWGWITAVGFALVGACIGSFLNVVVYRLPRGLSVRKPARSFCPTCGQPIPWHLNIPLLSWLALRGKSACCGKPISMRYPALEAACAALFLAAAVIFDYEALWVQLAVCVWLASMLAILAMDLESMEVHAAPVCSAALGGIVAAVGDAQLLEPSASSAWEGLLWSCVGIAVGFLLFRLVGLGGRLLFGGKRLQFSQPRDWRLAQEGEDIVLTVGEERLLWTEVFTDGQGSISLENAVVQQLSSPAGEVQLRASSLVMPEGGVHELEQYEHLSGTCTGLRLRREAMGRGDAWIAMSIGALCGWQGVLFSLVAGSFIGIALALVQRVGRGKPMPFGPSLIVAAFVWLFFAPSITLLLVDYFSTR